jgi:hypothetical protein
LDDLGLVETEALLEELFKRFDHVIFAATREHEADSQAHAGMYQGCPFTCAGLAAYIAKRTLNDWEGDCNDVEPGDL